MIFQVNKFECCSVTGDTDIEVSWNVGKGEASAKLFDIQRHQAVNYCFSSARDAILLRLENYIKSVRNLAGHDTGYYHTEGKAEAIKYLWRKLPELNDKDFSAICKNIVHLKNRIYSILPGESHPYYKGMQFTASEIIDFANQNCEASLENFINHLKAA